MLHNETSMGERRKCAQKMLFSVCGTKFSVNEAREMTYDEYGTECDKKNPVKALI